MRWMILNSDGSLLAEKDLFGTIWKTTRIGYANAETIDMAVRCKAKPPFKLIVCRDDGTVLVEDGTVEFSSESNAGTIRFYPGNLTHQQKPTGSVLETRVSIITGFFKRKNRKK